MSVVLSNSTITCDDCGFTTRDFHLAQRHSCEVTAQGGRCEDFPCCGHEAGDCNGEKYGSDEWIKEQEYDRIMNDYEGWEAGYYDEP